MVQFLLRFLGDYFFSDVFVPLAASVGGGVSSGLLICLFLGVVLFCIIRRKRRNNYVPAPSERIYYNPELYEYDDTRL